MTRRIRGWDIGWIKRIRSKLAVKVFLLTAALMASCCGITYLCMVHFAPYVYSHEAWEAEEVARELALTLHQSSWGEASFYCKEMGEILADQTEDEFVFHIFRASGDEVELQDLSSSTGRSMGDFEDDQKTDSYPFRFYDKEEEYRLFASQNTEKESQVVEALQKSLPVLSVLVLLLSVTAAFFYAWYLTRPIKKISRISRKMANLDFGGSCPSGRTDEIGVLSDSLNELSAKLSAALLELQEMNQKLQEANEKLQGMNQKLQEANEKLQEDVDRERQLKQQQQAFFAAASHELKTPLTIVKGQLEGMLYQVGRYRDRETYLARALAEVNDLEKMVRELLSVSRLGASEYVCQMSEFDFGRLTEERIGVYEEQLLQKEMTLEKILSTEVFLSGDPRLLEKVLDNLLSNASMYSPAGERVLVKL